MTLSPNEALVLGAARLRAAGVPDAGRDARKLLAFALGLDAAAPLARKSEALSAPQEQAFSAAIIRREARQPVAQIIGRRAFYELEFIVTPDVLDPRPESELLVEAALEHAAHTPIGRVLDLGVGSGCLLLSVLHHLPEAKGVGVDQSPRALEVARRNATRHGLAGRVELLRGDWFAPVEGRFDLILCNPPYVAVQEAASLAPEVREWEPHLALFAPENGLGEYARILPQLSRYLHTSGLAAFEMGAGQAEKLAKMARECGYVDIDFREDMGCMKRILLLREGNSGNK